MSKKGKRKQGKMENNKIFVSFRFVEIVREGKGKTKGEKKGVLAVAMKMCVLTVECVNFGQPKQTIVQKRKTFGVQLNENSCGKGIVSGGGGF